MILNVPGVVLSRRAIGEADRLAVLFTDALGKITVRFNGVRKSQAKLKALSEPLVWGEYRLYISPKSEFGKIIGGRIIDSFPRLRDDWRRTVEAMSCCELLSSLTVERNPNGEKYRLICDVLTALSAPTPPAHAAVTFGLRLLEESGLLPEGVDAGRPPADAAEAAGLQGLIYGHTEAQLGRPIKTRLFMESLAC